MLKQLDALFHEEEDLNLHPHVRFDSRTTFICGTGPSERTSSAEAAVAFSLEPWKQNCLFVSAEKIDLICIILETCHLLAGAGPFQRF